MSRTTHPELIIVGARVHRLDPDADPGPDAPVAEAVAVADGLIAAVGSAHEVRALAGPDTRVLERDDATIVPGLVDAHSHPILSLDVARGTSLDGIADPETLLAVLEAGRDALADGEWFVGWGLDPNVFSGDPIGNGILHSAFGADRPAFVTLFDAHSAIASDAALALAGITAPSRFDDGASIADDGTGRPSGHLIEFTAMRFVQDVMPVRSVPERAAELLALLRAMAAAGITETHVLDMQAADTIALLEAAEAQEELPVRLRISPWCEPTSTDEDVERLLGLQGRHGRQWRIEGIKFFIDGTVEGGTAWLDSPDTRGEGLASFWADAGAYARRIRFFHDHGVPTATHAIGERGAFVVAETLAALPSTGVQHRIEHLESVTDETIALIGRAGIATSMQPTHCTHYVRADGGDEWSRRLGADRAAHAWRTRDVRDAGAVLALGSDWPIAPFPPLTIMADAQLRRRAGRTGAVPVGLVQGLTAQEALEGYTTHAHRSIGGTGGAIREGERADLVVLDVDPLTVVPDVLAGGRVLLTVRDGRVTHEG